MFSLLMSKTAITGLLGLAVAALIGAAFWHYDSLVDENTRLSREVEEFHNAVEEHRQTIDAQRMAIDRWSQHAQELQRTMRRLDQGSVEAADEERRLEETFSNTDFGEEAAKDRRNLEDRVNAASDRIGRLLECASGSNDCPGANPGTAASDSAAASGAGGDEASQLGSADSRDNHREDPLRSR